MKIAYILHGHSRTWKECYMSFFGNVYSIAPGDIFIHTWDKVNASSGSHWNGWAEQSTGSLHDVSSQLIDLNGIVKAYHPKHLIVETDRGIEHLRSNYKYPVSAPHLGVKKMLESSLKIFEVARQIGRYDRYFSTRMDIKYLTKLDFHEIYSPHLVIPRTRFDNLPYVFDIWTVGSEQQLEVKTKFHHHVDQYWYNKSPDLHVFVYEEALANYYRDMGISTQKSTMKFCCPRVVGPPTYW